MVTGKPRRFLFPPLLLLLPGFLFSLTLCEAFSYSFLSFSSSPKGSERAGEKEKWGLFPSSSFSRRVFSFGAYSEHLDSTPLILPLSLPTVGKVPISSTDDDTLSTCHICMHLLLPASCMQSRSLFSFFLAFSLSLFG